MCLIYRMNTTNSKPPANNSGGIFGTIGKAFSNAKNAVVGSNNTKNATKPNNTKNATKPNNTKNAIVMPASTGVPNVPVTTGGMAPVNFRYPANMQQPSEEVMEWATTAGAPMPPAAMMRNVAHGGKRRNRTRRSKSRRGGSKRKSYRNKKRGGKRSNMSRNKSRRNKSCGGLRRKRSTINRNKSRRNRNH
jgi:hypothetical protein